MAEHIHTRLLKVMMMALKDGDSVAEEDVQIQAAFVAGSAFVATRHPRYVVAPTPMAIPGKLTRYGLSEVVNHLIQNRMDEDEDEEDDAATRKNAVKAPIINIPFDFFVDGNLLRTSIAKMAKRLGKSAEQTLIIEYVPAQMPPEEKKTEQKKEWISSTCGNWKKAMVAGCYDGTVYVHGNDGKEIERLNGHEGYVTCVTLAPPAAKTQKGCVVIAGGSDCTARVFRLDENGRKTSETHKVFRGHEMQVNCVASTTTRASNEDNEGGGDDGENSVRLFCTGSDDSTVKLWDLDGGMDSEEDASEKKKRDEEKESNDNNDDNNNNNNNNNKRKVDDEKIQNNQSGSAMLTLEGHTERVTGCAFENPRSLWTCSWDKSIRNWDVETGETRESFIGTDTSARTCLALRRRTDDLDMSGTETMCVIAHGGTDNIVRVWDPREGNSSGGTMLLRGHRVRLFIFTFFSFYPARRRRRRRRRRQQQRQRLLPYPSPYETPVMIKEFTYIL